METVDLDPIDKQVLMSDLQAFFDENTEDYYYQNGTPYQRTYLFYGPADIGKTSLSAAIVSYYVLPLYVIDLTDINDSTLQSKVQDLPNHCVILFEDINAAGIVMERTILPGKTKNDTDGSDISSEEDIVDEKSRNQKARHSRTGFTPALPQPVRNMQVALRRLLNTLSGLGSKEGHVVILTNNAPDPLDKAIYRPGHIELKLFLGYSTKVTAAIKFTRIFGSDKRLTMSLKELNRLGRHFGRLVPDNVLTPAEVQRSCMNRRGAPRKLLLI